MQQITATGILFENTAEKILVLRRNSDKPEGETWGLVGGKIEAGESPIEAAIRETREEVGISLLPEQLEMYRVYNWELGGNNLSFTVFKYLPEVQTLALNLDAAAHSEFKWEEPGLLYKQKDLMAGLYPILKDYYNLS